MINHTRWTCVLFAAALTLALGAPAQEAKAPEANLDSELSQQSYAAGALLGQGVMEPGVELDKEAFFAGLRDAFGDQEMAMEEGAMRAAFVALQQKMRVAAQEKATAEAESSKAEGDAFLMENAKKEGWNTTDSGLQYRVLEEGDGPSPKAEDRVSVHYTGTFISGEEFDSSVGGDPVQFGVGGVIPGWTEALQMMKVGGKWKLAIPGDLAYGPQGRPGIPPNATLLFEVELLDIIE